MTRLFDLKVSKFCSDEPEHWHKWNEVKPFHLCQSWTPFFLHIYDILEFGVSQSGLYLSDWLIDCLMFLPYRQYSSHVTAVALVSQMTNDSNIIVRFECMFVFHLFSLVCDTKVLKYESPEGTCGLSKHSKGKSLYRIVQSVPSDWEYIFTDYSFVSSN